MEDNQTTLKLQTEPREADTESTNLMVIFLVNNGGYTEYPFSVASGENNIITEFSVVNDS